MANTVSHSFLLNIDWMFLIYLWQQPPQQVAGIRPSPCLPLRHLALCLYWLTNHNHLPITWLSMCLLHKPRTNSDTDMTDAGSYVFHIYTQLETEENIGGQSGCKKGWQGVVCSGISYCLHTDNHGDANDPVTLRESQWDKKTWSMTDVHSDMPQPLQIMTTAYLCWFYLNPT